MRSLDELMAVAQEEKYLQTLGQADALAPVAEAVWTALKDRFELAIAEANDAATHPDTDEVKRPGWCARERGLRDLWREFEDLKSGAWKEWPDMQRKEEDSPQRRRGAERE